MEFIALVSSAKSVYETGKAIGEFFIDKTEQIINAIGKKELDSAIRTLKDIRYSQNKKREMESVITQLRLSMEKISYKKSEKFKIALLIALCYKSLGERELSEQFKSRSISFFNEWIDYRVECTTGHKSYISEMLFDNFVPELDEIGIQHRKFEPTKLSFFEELFNGGDLGIRRNNVVDDSKKFYSNYSNNLL